MNNGKIFLNLMVDEEDTKYTYILATKTNCKKLIEQCVDIWYEMSIGYENIKEFLEESEYMQNAGNKIDSRIIKLLEDNKEDDCDCFENALLFTQEVLEDCNEIIKSEETKIYW